MILYTAERKFQHQTAGGNQKWNTINERKGEKTNKALDHNQQVTKLWENKQSIQTHHHHT